MKRTKFFLIRCSLYVVGIFILAFSVAFAVNSNLGISPGNSLPKVISMVMGVSLGTMVTTVFSCYVVVQFILRKYVLKDLQNNVDILLLASQLIVSFMFGFFTDFAKNTLGDFCFGGPTLHIGPVSVSIGQLLMILTSIVLIAVGISIYMEVRLVAMPVDSLTSVLAKTFNISFHNMKVIQDCVTVFVSIVIGFIAYHKLVAVGIGTVLTAVFAGKVLGVLQKYINPVINRVCGFQEMR